MDLRRSNGRGGPFVLLGMNAALIPLDPATGAAENTPGVDLGALFDSHQAELFRLALRMSADRDEARDLVQESFLRAVRSRKMPSGPEAARAWLFRVLINLCRDRRRRQIVRRRAVETGAVGPAETPDDEHAAVARQTVRRALQTLPARQRAMVVLCELEGYSRAEVALALGVREVTVRWNLSRARKRLAAFIAAGGDDTRGARS